METLDQWEARVWATADSSTRLGDAALRLRMAKLDIAVHLRLLAESEVFVKTAALRAGTRQILGDIAALKKSRAAQRGIVYPSSSFAFVVPASTTVH
jgi:hypothetical protein